MRIYFTGKVREPKNRYFAQIENWANEEIFLSLLVLFLFRYLDLKIENFRKIT